jgi:hypothetical protein
MVQGVLGAQEGAGVGAAGLVGDGLVVFEAKDEDVEPRPQGVAEQPTAARGEVEEAAEPEPIVWAGCIFLQRRTLSRRQPRAAVPLEVPARGWRPLPRSARRFHHEDPRPAKLALHHILPLALPEWPEDTLDELLDDLDPDKVETYEHALIMLAHHPSERAGELLLQIAQDAPLDLAPLAELAYAEQAGLRGMDYLKLREGHAPTIRPTTGG